MGAKENCKTEEGGKIKNLSFAFFVMVGVELTALTRLGKCSTTEIHSQPRAHNLQGSKTRSCDITMHTAFLKWQELQSYILSCAIYILGSDYVKSGSHTTLIGKVPKKRLKKGHSSWAG